MQEVSHIVNNGIFVAGIESGINISSRGAYLSPNEVVKVSLASDAVWPATPSFFLSLVCSVSHCMRLHRQSDAYAVDPRLQNVDGKLQLRIRSATMANVVAAKAEIERVIDDQQTTPSLCQLDGQGGEVCVDFQRGHCRRGSSCELSHLVIASVEDKSTYAGLVVAADLKRGRLEDRRRAFGSNHPQTAVELVSLAGLLVQIHDFAGAWGHAEEAYCIRYWALGAHHPETAAALQVRNWAWWAGTWAKQSQANQVPGRG